MRRAFLILQLISLPAVAELEVVSSRLVSRLPDGLGEVVQSDLDGDGDRDLLVTGKRNDFLGWIESTAAGPAGALRPIDTAAIPVAGQRPMVANLDGGAFADLHFPGWKIPVGFRSFGTPEPHPASAGHEFLAAYGDMIIARSTVTGEWVRITPAGVLPLSPDGAILRSDSSPTPGQVHIGDLNRDGSLDLMAVMNGVTRNGTAVSPGLYWLPLSSSTAASLRRIAAAVPRLVTPVHDDDIPQRIIGVVAGFDRTLQDDSPPIDPPVLVTGIHLYSPGSSEFNTWGNRFVINVGPGASALAAFPANSVQSVTLEVAAPDPDYGTGSLRRYRSVSEGAPIKLGIHLLSEAGNCGIQLLGNTGSRLLTFSSTATTPGAETIRRLEPGDLLDTDPGDGLDSLPLAGRLVAGPFGTLVHASWQDLAEDGTPELVAATEVCEAILRFDPPNLQAPRSMTALADPFFRIPGKNGPPIFGDLDGDGDVDLARSFQFYDNYYLQSVWENLGENLFSLDDPFDRFSFAESEVYVPFRVDHDPASNRARVFYSKPGIVIAEWFTPQPGDPYPNPTLYPGTGAQVVASDHDIDGDGHLDFVFFPSAFGNAVAWGKWNPAGGYLDSLDQVAAVPAGVTIPSLTSGDLDGDGTPDLFHPSLDPSGLQVTWVAARLAADTLTSFSHPAVTLPEAATRVLPLDLDEDGDIDLVRLIPDTAAPVQADGIRPHELRWSEYIGGLWVHHDTDLGTLRTSASIPEPVLRKAGDRTLVVNRIGEILELRTRVTAPSAPVAAFLASAGITGASAGDDQDPDGDGIPNFAEILAGTSAVAADSGFSIPMQLLANGWTVSLPVSLSELGVTGRLETSDDLSGWTRHDAAPLSLGVQAGRHRYLFADPGLSSTPAKRFARIHFAQP